MSAVLFNHDNANISSVSNDLDVPQITVLGQQSAGKSSVVEGMSGFRTLGRKAHAPGLLSGHACCLDFIVEYLLSTVVHGMSPLAQ